MSVDDDDRAEPGRAASRVEQVRGAEDVGRERLPRLLVGEAHDRLGREVQDDLGLEADQGPLERLGVAHVPHDVLEIGGEPQRVEHRGLGGGREGEPAHVGPEPEEPGHEPAPLEPRVPGDEDPLARPEPGGDAGNHRRTHGGLPLAQSSFR